MATRTIRVSKTSKTSKKAKRSPIAEKLRRRQTVNPNQRVGSDGATHNGSVRQTAEFVEMINAINVKLTSIDHLLSTVYSRSSRIESLETSLAALNRDVASVRNRVSRLGTQVRQNTEPASPMTPHGICQDLYDAVNVAAYRTTYRHVAWRLIRAFRENGIRSLADLRRHSWETLWNMRGVKHISLESLRLSLRQRGIALPGEIFLNHQILNNLLTVPPVYRRRPNRTEYSL